MGDKDTAIAILRVAFPKLEEPDLAGLAEMAIINHYPPGTVLCREGEISQALFVLAEGRVRITQSLSGGVEREVNVVDAPDLIGELALIEAAPRTATVRAVTGITVLTLYQHVFIEALKHNPTLGMIMAEATIKRVRTIQQRDINEMRRRHDEIRAAYHTLTEYNRLRTAFLDALGQELRAPVGKVSEAVHALRARHADPNTVRQAMQDIDPDLKQVVRLVNDLLVVQEMDLIAIRNEPMDMVSLTHEVIQSLAEKAQKNRTPILLNAEPDLPTLYGDPDGLRRIWSVLLDNAIKFSPEGGDITLTLRASDDHLTFEVADHGIGIPTDYLPHVFDRFQRRSRVGHYQFEGLGLGLATAHYLVERYGGTIGVESVHAVGSIFTVRLPLTPPERSADKQTDRLETGPLQPETDSGPDLAEA